MNGGNRSFTSVLGVSLLLIIVASGFFLRGVSGANDDQPTQITASAKNLLGAKLEQTSALADFNGDGLMDVAVVDFLTDSVSVMVGDRAGYFHSVTRLSPGGGPRAIVAADFNRDGIVDLAVANFFSGDVAVFASRGDGSFEQRRRVKLGEGLASLVGEDFDSDGSPDLAVANFLSGEVMVLRGAADGSFAAPALIGQVAGVTLILSRDSNEDGVKDLIAFDVSGGEARLFAGDGGGSFREAGNVDPVMAISLADAEELRAIRKLSGDGQSAPAGAALPQPLVVEVGGQGESSRAGRQLSFSTLYGDAEPEAVASRTTDGQGQASLSLSLGELPGNNLVAAAIPGGQVTVFSAFSVLSTQNYFAQARVALAQLTLEQSSLRQQIALLIDQAEQKLSDGNRLEAVGALSKSAELLTGPFSRQTTESQSVIEVVELTKRLITQILLFVPEPLAARLVRSGVEGRQCSPEPTNMLIGYGELITCAIDPAGDIDVFRFQGSATEAVSIQLTYQSGSGRPCLELFDPSGVLVGSHCPNAFSSRIDKRLESTGTFTIRASAWNNSTMSYSLSLERVAPPSASATPLRFNQNFADEINPTGDIDLYYFTGAINDLVTIQLTHQSGSGRPCLELFDPTGVPIGTHCPNAFSARIDKRLESAGTYTLRVSAWNNGTMNYSVDLQCVGECPPPLQCPTVSGITPSSGAVGASVTITGTNLIGVTSVRFFSTNITSNFTVHSDTLITTTVPSGAASGPITISKPNCADVQTQNFTVTTQPPCPIVSSLNPTSGQVGASVTITGANFTGITAIRFFNNVTATNFSVNGGGTLIIVNVPSGAITGPITISKPPCPDAQTGVFEVTTNRVVRVKDTSGAPGSSVTVPVELVSQGDENALGFSLTFDPNVLSFQQAALGSDAAGATLNTNQTQVGLGRLGVTLALPAGQRFNAGAREILRLIFVIASNTSASATQICFGDQPIRREVSGVSANILPADHACGAVTITAGIEGDVAPRPNGDGRLSVIDWVQCGRFTAGIDTPAPGSEFQRADCAPRETRGDGRISTVDWVQCGRYVAGLDPTTPAGGPAAPVAGNLNTILTRAGAKVAASGPRAVRVINANLERGRRGAVTIELDAQGDENAAGFSLNFDPAQLRFDSAVIGSGATGATLNVNSSQAESGRVGLALALPSGQVIAAGLRPIVNVSFEALSGGTAASTTISFGDQPIAREISGVNANLLPADYVPGTVTITGLPSEPSVSSISPLNPAASGSEQSVTVNGSGFQSGLTVTVTGNNSQSTISGAQIQNVTATSFVMRVILNAPGNWSLRVNNPDGRQSNTFGFTVITITAPPAPCITTVPSGRWRGEYFNNRDLSGAPAMVRDDGNGFINFNWGAGSPSSDCGISADNFSARLARAVNFAAGVYRFTVTADDGVRLYVDDILKVDKWINQSATTYTADVDLAAGSHSIKLEYYENGGLAMAQLSWEPVSPSCAAVVSPGNWKGEYFNNKDLGGAPTMVRDDGVGSIDFDWDAGSPSALCGIGADNFSVRWTRMVNFNSASSYRFTVTADDGVRLFVDNQLLLDKWINQSATTYTVDVLLAAGDHAIRLEYFENGGLARAKLSWNQAGYQLYGINFGPYVDGQDPNLGSQVSEEQLRARMRIVAPHTRWIRTFGCANGLEKAGRIAREFGLRTAIGAWLSPDLAANEREIANLIAVAQAGEADLLIVGSEVLLRRDLTPGELLNYINRIKQAAPGIPVTTADVYGEMLAHPTIIAAVDVLMVNIYGYFEEIRVDAAMAALHHWYQRMVAVAGGKTVIVSETGWPSCGPTKGQAVPSPENASFYFLNFVSWALANNISYFYFSAFDESWKARYEGPQGACWGIWDKDGNLKPGMRRVFDGETMPDNWTLPGGPGQPRVELTDVPAYGSSDDLKGQVWHLKPDDHKVAVYIRVGSGWWTKPTFAQPLTPIQPSGRWVCDIVTGGSDHLANRIAAFVFRNGYNPPLMSGGGALPPELDQNAVAKVEVARAP